MLSYTQELLFDEISENDRKINTEETISGLNLAGFLLATIARGSEEGERSMAIDGLEAVISAMTYVSLMHTTAENIKEMKGQKSCA